MRQHSVLAAAPARAPEKWTNVTEVGEIISPSRARNGAVKPILEAGASGLPVVATRHAGIPDVVVEERTGLLVDEHDVAGMAAGMIRLIDEPAFAAHLGAAGRDHVRTNFSMDRSLDRLWAIIAACFESPAGSLGPPRTAQLTALLHERLG